MAVRNFLSGCEGRQHLEAVVKSGAEHALCSYLYVRKAGVDLLKQRKKKYPHMQFMIDSGAHTLMESYQQKFKTWKVQDFEDYCIAYRDWLLKNLDYVDVAVELDIDFCINWATGRNQDDAYGTKIVAEWQEKYFRPLEEKGLPIIYVWHEPRGLPGWEEMCSNFAYVGLPGELSRLDDFNKFITVAKRYTTKIHGFGCGRQVDFRDYPWHSIDSTSWKDSERYGVLLHWDEHKQRFIYDQDKTRRHLYRQYMLKHGLPADDIIAGKDYKSFTVFALISMTLMEKFYQRKYASRVFYYELRLPHPKAISKMSDNSVNEFWVKCNGNDVFKIEPALSQIREILYWLSLVQYKKTDVFHLPLAMAFFNKYFGGLLVANPNDIVGLQKALAEKISPPNPPAIQRGVSDFKPTNNPPKSRDSVELELSDLEWGIETPEGLIV